MEIFKYEVDEGVVMDYLDHRFLMVIKDHDWNDEQIRLLAQPLDLSFGSRNGVVFFVLESLPIDSADFYFEPELSDQKEEFLADLREGKNISLELVFLNENNEILRSKSMTLNQADSSKLWKLFEEQRTGKAYQDEVSLLTELYDPYELAEQSAQIRTKI